MSWPKNRVICFLNFEFVVIIHLPSSSLDISSRTTVLFPFFLLTRQLAEMEVL